VRDERGHRRRGRRDQLERRARHGVGGRHVVDAELAGGRGGRGGGRDEGEN
jgi:hypothetical protein